MAVAVAVVLQHLAIISCPHFANCAILMKSVNCEHRGILDNAEQGRAEQGSAGQCRAEAPLAPRNCEARAYTMYHTSIIRSTEL